MQLNQWRSTVQRAKGIFFPFFLFCYSFARLARTGKGSESKRVQWNLWQTHSEYTWISNRERESLCDWPHNHIQRQNKAFIDRHSLDGRQLSCVCKAAVPLRDAKQTPAPHCVHCHLNCGLGFILYWRYAGRFATEFVQILSSVVAGGVKWDSSPFAGTRRSFCAPLNYLTQSYISGVGCEENHCHGWWHQFQKLHAMFSLVALYRRDSEQEGT